MESAIHGSNGSSNSTDSGNLHVSPWKLRLTSMKVNLILPTSMEISMGLNILPPTYMEVSLEVNIYFQVSMEVINYSHGNSHGR